jgi:hypothetical protein
VSALQIPITQTLAFIKKVVSKINSLKDIPEQLKMYLDLLKLLQADLKVYIALIAAIPKAIAKIFKINPLKLLNFPKIDLPTRKREINKQLSNAMNDSANKINNINKDKSNVYKDMSAINDAKNAIAKAVNEATSQNPGVDPNNLTSEIQNQLSIVLNCTCISNEDRSELLNLTGAQYTDSNIGIKAKQLVGQITLKGANKLASLDADVDLAQSSLENLRKIQRRVADLQLDFKTPQNLFDISLGVGLMAYWIGGVIPSAGVATVILPGLPPVALGLKTDFSGPLRFFTSLEMIFQIHALTVVGVFVPPPPAPPVPWVGYF